MTIGAIQTEYKGYLFRSRLEARWAVFFDALGIEWKYETEGYEIDGKRYLPDFWLPAADAWVEVKGDPKGLRNEFDRMVLVLGQRSPLPGFAAGKSELIVLGDVPEGGSFKTILHPTFSRKSGILARTWGFFVTAKGSPSRFLSDADQSVLYLLFGKYAMTDPGESPSSPAWDFAPWVLETPGSFQAVVDAYRAARQARFEHGVQGR